MRFHETLLFLRAFPQGPAVVKKTEQLLNSFRGRVDQLRKAGDDLSELLRRADEALYLAKGDGRGVQRAA